MTDKAGWSSSHELWRHKTVRLGDGSTVTRTLWGISHLFIVEKVGRNCYRRTTLTSDSFLEQAGAELGQAQIAS